MAKALWNLNFLQNYQNVPGTIVILKLMSPKNSLNIYLQSSKLLDALFAFQEFYKFLKFKVLRKFLFKKV